MKPAGPMELLKEAKKLYSSSRLAVLSTHSKKLEGFPFGSIVGYALDYNDQILILISALAQHTQNLLANPKASLLVGDWNQEAPQVGCRLTMMGQIMPATDVDGGEYFQKFPETKEWAKLDFSFFRFEMEKALYVGGFGRILDLKGEDFLHSSKI